MADRSVSVFLKANVDGYLAAVEKAKLSTRDFANDASASATKHKESWDKVGQGMMATGAVIAVGVGLAVKTFMDFDASMSQAQAGTMATGASLEALRAAAIDMGAKTQFSATEAADAITAMGKAGVSTKDILGGGLKGALDLAAAGQLDVATASEIAATAMNQFGLEGKDIPHVADLLAAGAGKAMGSVQDLAGALKYVGPVAKGLGISIEETTGTLAMFAQQGILGEQAGTSMRGMLLTLTSPSKIAAKAMEDLGINVYGADGKFIGLQGAAGQLHDKLGPLDEATRNAALGQIFGNEQVTAARVLYEGGAPAVAEWTAKVNDTGFAAKQAAMLTDNLKGDVERLGGSLSSVLIQSGSATNDMLRSMTQNLQGALDMYGQMPAGVQKGVTVLGAFVGAGALATGGMITLLPKIQETRVALENMGKAGSLISGGFSKVGSVLAGPFGAALAVGVIGLGYFAKQSADSKKRVDELAASLDQQTGALTESTRATVAKGLADSGALEDAKSFGVSVSDVTDVVLGVPGALEKVDASLTLYRQGLDGANAADVIASTDQWRTALVGSNSEVDKAVAKTKMLNEASTTGGGAAVIAAEKAKVYTAAVADQAKAVEENAKAHDALIKEITDYGSQMMIARGDARGYEAAIDAATAALKENGRTLDIGTEKGRANQAALDAIATTALKVAGSTLESAAANGTLSAATKTVTDDVGKARTQFIDMAVKMGMSKTAAAALADQSGLTAGRVKGLTGELVDLGKQKPKPVVDLDLTPAQKKRQAIQTEIDNIKQGNAPGIDANTAAGKAKIADLEKQIRDLQGKNVTIGVTANFMMGTGGGGSVIPGIFTNNPGALGGPVTGGVPGKDSVPRMLMPNEYIVRADGSNLGDAMAHYGVPGMATGGPVGMMPPPYPTRMDQAGKGYLSTIGFKPDFAAMAASGGGGGAAQWAGVVLQVLSLLGQSPTLLAGVLRLINKESGGNPAAINLTDSNAAAGHPSQGLMQTIPGTFAAYAGPYAGLGITNPLANIYAGLNYALHTYGSIAAVDPLVHAGGYDTGGLMMPGAVGKNSGNLPERVLSGRQTESFERLVASMDGARSAAPTTVNVAAPTVHVYVDGKEFKGMVRVELAANARARTTTTRQLVGAK